MRDTNLIEDLRQLLPPDWSWVLWVGALVAMTAVLARWWRSRRRHRLTVRPPSPDAALAAWEEAMRALEHLSALLVPEQSRAYAVGSTGVLRRYLERRYGLHAPRLTTEEFLDAACQTPVLAAEQRAALGEFLGRCDLMKFGRAVAEAEELRQLHEAAVAFVLTTRPAAAMGVEEGAGA